MKLSPFPIFSLSEGGLIGLQHLPFSFSSSSSGIVPKADSVGWDAISLGVEGAWDPNYHDLTINAGVLISNPGYLFGRYLCSEAIAGIGIEWKSRQSAQRGISKITSFNRHSGEVHADFELTFRKAQIRGALMLDLNLYVIHALDAADVLPGEEHLANRDGLILGRLCDSCEITWDIDRELFPITETGGRRTDSLWRMVFMSEDPANDPFSSEYLSLELNRNHPDYTEFKGQVNSNSDPLSPLACEVISSWMSLVFLKIKDEHPELFNKLCTGTEEGDFYPDSIASTAGYCTRFNINTESHEDLFASVRKVVSEKIHSDCRKA